MPYGVEDLMTVNNKKQFPRAVYIVTYTSQIISPLSTQQNSTHTTLDC